MTARRRLLAAASAALSLTALAACEKPAPIVTLVNAGSSTYAEANTYCFDGESTDSGSCATRHDGATTLAFDSAQPVGIDVDKELAEAGWYYEIQEPGSQQVAYQSPAQDGHYATLPGVAPGSSFDLFVYQGVPTPQPAAGSDPAGAVPASATATGVWQFSLVPR